MTHAAHCQPAPIEMPPPTKREYLSVSQAAAAAPIPCNGQTVVRWIMHGVLAPSGGRGLRLRVFLHAKKCGGRWAIARADLHAFFEATTAVPAGTRPAAEPPCRPAGRVNTESRHAAAMRRLAAMGLPLPTRAG